MPEVPRILHGTSEETMLEHLETSERANAERRGALSASPDKQIAEARGHGKQSTP